MLVFMEMFVLLSSSSEDKSISRGKLLLLLIMLDTYPLTFLPSYRYTSFLCNYSLMQTPSTRSGSMPYLRCSLVNMSSTLVISTEASKLKL